MSQNNSQQWQWSETAKQWFYANQRTQEYVLQNGNRIPFPRAAPSSYNASSSPPAQPSAHYGRPPSQYGGSYYPGPTTPSSGSSQELVRDEVQRYRLLRASLEGYLCHKFPECRPEDFELQEDDDSWLFRVPRRLSKDEKSYEINPLRYKD